MNNNLKIKAKKLYTMFLDKDMDSVQDVYEELTKIAYRVKVYFEKITPIDFIKLVFYIWSLLKTNQFDLGERLYTNSYFAKLFINEEENYKKSCENCLGNCEVYCRKCDGSSTIRCDKCLGSGNADCEDCDGDDENCDYCDGYGRVICQQCGGEGTINCEQCNDGLETCSECMGFGEIDSDEKKITSILILTWDNHIKNRCELTVKMNKPTLTLGDFEKRSNNYIILNTKETHFETDAIPDKLYCSYYTNNTLLPHYMSDMKINTY